MEILAALKDTPIPTLLVIGGLIFLFLGIATIKKPIVIDVTPTSRKISLVLGGVLVVMGLYLLSQPSSAQQASETPVPLENTATTAQVFATEKPSNDPLGCKVFSDDFETGTWGENRVLSWGSWEHANGEYKMSIFAPDYLSVSCKLCNDLYQKDFRISVNARTPQFKGSWGIYFWGKDKIRYSFELDENSNAMFKQYDDYDYNILDSNQVNLSTINRLTMEYINGLLVGYVNGEQVVKYSIPSPPVIGNYGVGLIESSFSSDSSEVFFDDFSFSGCPK